MKIKTNCYEDWSAFAFKGDKDKEQVIDRRFQRATETYRNAIFCLHNGMYDASADSLYFSWLNACRALLLSIDKETSNIYILFLRFYLNFVVKDFLPRKYYDMLIVVYNLNQLNVALDIVEIEKTDIEPFLEPTKEFLVLVAGVLNRKLEGI